MMFFKVIPIRFHHVIMRLNAIKKRLMWVIICALSLSASIKSHAWEQKEFIIGTYSPPIVSPDIILLPGDYDGEKYLSLPMPQFERVPASENVV